MKTQLTLFERLSKDNVLKIEAEAKVYPNTWDENLGVMSSLKKKYGAFDVTINHAHTVWMAIYDGKPFDLSKWIDLFDNK